MQSRTLTFEEVTGSSRGTDEQGNEVMTMTYRGYEMGVRLTERKVEWAVGDYDAPLACGVFTASWDDIVEDNAIGSGLAMAIAAVDQWLELNPPSTAGLK
jgi:hypothetical protein